MSRPPGENERGGACLHKGMQVLEVSYLPKAVAHPTRGRDFGAPDGDSYTLAFAEDLEGGRP